MLKTTFRVPKMDCPSEERLIRMATEGNADILKLEFDLQKREVVAFHNGEAEKIAKQLEPLKLGSHIVLSQPVHDSDEVTAHVSNSQTESKVLKILLGINAGMFVAELAAGVIARSTGLIADSLDMFADAAVYGLSLYAVGKTAQLQNQTSRVSGFFQLILALGVFLEVVRRFVNGSEPDSAYMIGIAFLALVANVTCMFLLSKHRTGGAHMKASWIFSTNDVIANCGVIVAGILVALTGSNLPDLIIGSFIAFVVLRGAFKIFALSRNVVAES